MKRKIKVVIEGMEDGIVYRRFLPEKEYLESFERQGKTVPPFLAFQPYVERDGVKGYMVPCKKDDPDAEEWDK